MKKRTTIYLDSGLYQALRFKAEETERSVSGLIQEALKVSLTEDSIDLAAFNERRKEQSLAFDDVCRQ